MTTTGMDFRSASIFGLALALLLPVQVAAQSPAGQASAKGAHERAARVLEREAAARADDSKTYAEAGELYREAARIRGDDPGAVADFRSAGRLAHYRGRDERAVADLEKAGELARKLDMSTEALQSYLDAAWVAQRSGQHDEAVRLVQRIRHLSRDWSFMAQAEPDVVARVFQLGSQTS